MPSISSKIGNLMLGCLPYIVRSNFFFLLLLLYVCECELRRLSHGKEVGLNESHLFSCWYLVAKKNKNNFISLSLVQPMNYLWLHCHVTWAQFSHEISIYIYEYIRKSVVPNITSMNRLTDRQTDKKRKPWILIGNTPNNRTLVVPETHKKPHKYRNDEITPKIKWIEQNNNNMEIVNIEIATARKSIENGNGNYDDGM